MKAEHPSATRTVWLYMLILPSASSREISRFMLVSGLIPLSQLKSSSMDPLPDMVSSTIVALFSPRTTSTTAVPLETSLFWMFNAFAVSVQFPVTRFLMLTVLSVLSTGPKEAPPGPVPETEYLTISIRVEEGMMVRATSSSSLSSKLPDAASESLHELASSNTITAANTTRKANTTLILLSFIFISTPSGKNPSVVLYGKESGIIHEQQKKVRFFCVSPQQSRPQAHKKGSPKGAREFK